MTLRLIYMGTPAFALPTLKALHAAGHDIAAVYSQPPRPAGRGMALQKSPVHQLAESLGLPVRTPASFKAESDREDFANLKADAAIVVAYGLLLPKAILQAVPEGCFNLHPSLLPRWRGAAPLQRAIMAGDAQTGIAVMRMEEGLDTGPICLAENFPLTDTTTAAQLHDWLADKGADLMVEAMAKLEANSLKAQPQAEQGITYAAKITKAEARINFDRPAHEVLRHIHGLSPFPGAWTQMGQARVKILQAESVPLSGPAGSVLDDDLTLACASGAIRPIILQREGKAPMARADFLRGHPVPKGTHL